MSGRRQLLTIAIVGSATVLLAFAGFLALPGSPADLGAASASPVPSAVPVSPGSSAASSSSHPLPSASGAASSPAASASSAADTPDPILAGFGIGGPARAIRLPIVGGGTFDLAANLGHPVWLEFTASWCPSCRDDARVLRSFAERYASAGLRIVAVDIREDAATAAGFAPLFGSRIPLAMDADGAVTRDWRVVAFPARVFIDAEGIVRDAGIGSAEPPAVALSLERILPGVSVTP